MEELIESYRQEIERLTARRRELRAQGLTGKSRDAVLWSEILELRGAVVAMTDYLEAQKGS